MGRDAIGAIGQAVSALVLFGVFVQIRHAREEMRRSILEARQNVGRELDLTRATDERLGQIRAKANAALHNVPFHFTQALMDRAGLSYQEAETIFFEQLAYWRHIKTAVAYMDQTPDDRSEAEAGIRAQYSDDALARFWYQQMKSVLNPATVRYVDDVLRAG